MRKQHLILATGILSVLFLAIPVTAQKGFNGEWTWRSAMNKKKEQAAVWVNVKLKGTNATGTIWFNMLVDGEADGSDASAIPFIGTMKGDTLTIEFDPNDVRAIDEENIRYRKPRGKPATADLRLKSGKLEWIQTQGAIALLGIPKQMTMRREN